MFPNPKPKSDFLKFWRKKIYPEVTAKAEPQIVKLIILMFYLLKGLCCNQTPKVVQLFLLIHYVFELGNVYVTSKSAHINGLFEMSKLFYPPKGSGKPRPMGSNWYSYGLLSFVTSKLKMEIHQNMSEENLYPPRRSAKALPIGSNWFSYSLLSLVNEKWSFNFELVIHQKISS